MLNRLYNTHASSRKERKKRTVGDEHETTTKSGRNPPRMELSFEFLLLSRSFGTKHVKHGEEGNSLSLSLSRGGNPFGMINAREDSEFRGQARPRYARAYRFKVVEGG